MGGCDSGWAPKGRLTKCQREYANHQSRPWKSRALQHVLGLAVQGLESAEGLALPSTLAGF